MGWEFDPAPQHRQVDDEVAADRGEGLAVAR
jgi:hypothetical protein